METGSDKQALDKAIDRRRQMVNKGKTKHARQQAMKDVQRLQSKRDNLGLPEGLDLQEIVESFYLTMKQKVLQKTF